MPTILNGAGTSQEPANAPLTISEAAAKISGLLSSEEAGTQPPRKATPQPKPVASDEPKPTATTDEPALVLDDGADEATQDEGDEQDEEGADVPTDDAESDSDDGETDETPQPDADPKHRVKVDGEEIEVPLSELLKGYSREQNYTRRSMELADLQRSQAAEFDAVRAERAQYAELLPALKAQIEQMMGPEPDWAKLKAEDPIEFAAQVAQRQLQQSKLAAIEAEQRRIDDEAERDRRGKLREQISVERVKLLEALPAWKNPEVAKKEKLEVRNYARSLGFTDEELGQTIDHRAVVALHKAMKYDQAVDRAKRIKPQPRPGVQPQSVKPAPVDRSKPSKVTRYEWDKKRALETGTVAAAAAAIKHML